MVFREHPRWERFQKGLPPKQPLLCHIGSLYRGFSHHYLWDNVKVLQWLQTNLNVLPGTMTTSEFKDQAYSIPLDFSPTKSYPYPTLSFATGRVTKAIPPTKYFQGKATWRAQWIHNWFCWILTYLEKEVRPMSMSRSTKQISEQSTLTSAEDACAFHTDLGFVL